MGTDIFMGGGAGNIGGVDEVDDPELAEAIRMSLQESQAANQQQPPQNQGDQGAQREQT